MKLFHKKMANNCIGFLKGVVIGCVIFIATSAFAAISPTLFFSDIISGPKTGLNDGLGQGAIITVWGNRLGDSQGSSKILINGIEAAHVYYWENADPQTGISGPSDMYKYHKMQEIAFSIPSAAPDGLNKIKVQVNGVDSNELSFTIRSGNIYYVKKFGNNTSGIGSWTSPWATVNYYDSPAGAASKAVLKPGDIIYVCDGVSEGAVSIRDKKGTSTMPFALIAYPGAYYNVVGGIQNYYPYNSDYWVFSKISVRTESTGISAFKGMRAVGNEITDSVCADGQSGAISGAGPQAGGGIKALGNYIHDFGCSSTTSLHHVFYLSNRSGSPIEAYELGWNYLADNDARHGLHIYDESACGDYTGIFRIHDNVVVNQKGAAFNANASGDSCITAPIEVYNNIFINCGLSPWQNYVINVTMSGLTSHIRFYNNTIYGYSEDNANGGALYVQANGSPSWNFGGTWEWLNNIVVDTSNRMYHDPNYFLAPQVHGNNIWYNGGDGNPASPPSWDTSPITDDPRFVNSLIGDFNLRSNSPCIGKGTSTVGSIVKDDIRGVSRPQIDTVTNDLGYDIGAFEYIVDSPTIHK